MNFVFVNLLCEWVIRPNICCRIQTSLFRNKYNNKINLNIYKPTVVVEHVRKFQLLNIQNMGNIYYLLPFQTHRRIIDFSNQNEYICVLLSQKSN